MRILVLGATGRTGGKLVAAALAAGHDVSALVRDPERLGQEAGHLRIVTGTAEDTQAMERACAGQQAVLCALGPRSPRESRLKECPQTGAGSSPWAAAGSRWGSEPQPSTAMCSP